MTNNKGNDRGLEKRDRIDINMAETKKRIVKSGYRTIYPVNSVNETKLEFIDSWRQEALW